MRFAAMELESQRHFVTVTLLAHPRWRSHSRYLLGLHTSGNVPLSVDPHSLGHAPANPSWTPISTHPSKART